MGINLVKFMESWRWKNKTVILASSLIQYDSALDDFLMEKSDQRYDVFVDLKQFDGDFECVFEPGWIPLRITSWLQPKYCEAEVTGFHCGDDYMLIYLDMR